MFIALATGRLATICEAKNSFVSFEAEAWLGIKL